MNRCEICGSVIAEIIPICNKCSGESEEVKELRDIASVLSITEGTDANIKNAVEGILKIAERLEGGKNDKEIEES